MRILEIQPGPLCRFHPTLYYEQVNSMELPRMTTIMSLLRNPSHPPDAATLTMATTIQTGAVSTDRKCPGSPRPLFSNSSSMNTSPPHPSLSTHPLIKKPPSHSLLNHNRLLHQRLLPLHRLQRLQLLHFRHRQRQRRPCLNRLLPSMLFYARLHRLQHHRLHE